jgi:16S rRNA (cytosine967-C5)-methyltransferase
VTPSPARIVALDTLQRVEVHGAWADVTLGRRLERAGLDPADQALATRLVYGTLAWQGRLDWHLARLCTTAPARLDAWLRVILRLGLYQLLFLDRVPAYAIVDTSVELAKRFRRGAATGLVNATLRRAALDPSALRPPDDGIDPVGALAVRWSHPRWLVARWREEVGAAEVEALLRADQDPAPTVLRVNTLRADRQRCLDVLERAGLSAAPTRYSPAGIELAVPLSQARAAIPAGWTTVQGEASQLVSYLVAPRAGERVLDACAAPGGKTTHLAELMRNTGALVAADPNRRGLAEVQERSATLGASIVSTRQDDVRALAHARDAGDRPLVFDRVLVDAPCSGLGTLRGHPERRWRVTEQQIADLAQLAWEILEAAAQLCTPGGTLVYATCTISRPENDTLLDRFLATHPAFCLVDPREEMPIAARPLLDDRGILRTFPHRHGLDGFFAARLQRHPTPG